MSRAVPGCGKPPANRIEIYVPGEATERGNLDGFINACAEHTAELLEVIGWDVDGVTALCIPLSEPIAARCGSGYDFIAGAAIEAPEPRGGAGRRET